MPRPLELAIVFQLTTGTIFKPRLSIIDTNVLPKFHEDWTINVTSRQNCPVPWPPGGHVFKRTGTILKLSRDIIETNLMTKFHEDWTKNKTSRVLTSFELDQDIIWKNRLTKFHEDQTINVASRVLTRQNVDDKQCTIDKR
ncbi:hypothetical protein DPMN_058635 [Dreissena polymorpha]|uniref:Uncharacterized protein n=1 Tax=Dreissena polymorpha TaxID=45954 RepID=A0A9D4C2I8_DREPO|nr:hypothetical protein DPMN_058635 [Dreissena polymorpha]